MTARTVDIELDRPRHLRYALGAVKMLKREHGINLFDLSDEQAREPETLSLLLWAGLVWEDASLTVEQIDDMVDVSQLGYVSDKIGEAMSGTKPDDPFAISSESSTATTDSAQP